jgi:hypothetical protein
VKPALRTSQTVAAWPIEVRYFWVLLWGYLDDLGRGLDIPKAIAGDCFPLDDKVTANTIDRWLSLMAKSKMADRDAPVCRYIVAGHHYVHAVHWSEHQRPNRPSPSKYPPCPIHEELSDEVAAAFDEAGDKSLGGASDQGRPTSKIAKSQVTGRSRQPDFNSCKHDLGPSVATLRMSKDRHNKSPPQVNGSEFSEPPLRRHVLEFGYLTDGSCRY